ncbi:MAG TPA: hypothetical protein VNO30_04905 [Kofleriaceae bacterium]|nr:hypothetical protein [Kofleriaceae bacterium]
MGERLPKLLLLLLATTTVGGCSKLYDPDRLRPAADAPPPPIDIEPCNVMVTDVSPTVLFEGVGAGGGRPALVVISGENLVNQNMTVTLKSAEGAPKAMQFEFDSAKLDVGAHGQQLAVSVPVPVDTTPPANGMITFDVVVAQDCPEGRVTASLLGKLALKELDELPPSGTSPAMVTLTGGVHEYSQIDVRATTALVPAADQTKPIILRSKSSVKIASNISVNASGMPGTVSMPSVGGPGGGRGGLAGSGVGGVGTPGTGPFPGQSSGAAGSFNMNDPGLSTLNEPNRGSGGAGGDGSTLGRGGRGGGGGGSIEITARGTLEVAKISALGTPGEASPVLGGAPGGGGSGGVILLRAEGALTAGDLDVSGGGTGARGRARYDAIGAPTLSDGALGKDHYRGPMFVDPPQVTHTAALQFAVVGKPLATFRYFVIISGGGVSPIADAMFDALGNARITLRNELQPGANQLCIVVEGANATSDTSNCADVAYLR